MLAQATIGVMDASLGDAERRARMSDSDGETANPRQRRWLYNGGRWVLAKWWWLEVSVLLLGLLTNILLLPLSQGLNQWGQGVKSQVAELLALPGTQPITFSISIVVFIALTVVGSFADRAVKRDEERKSRQQQEAITRQVMATDIKEPLTQLIADVTTVRERVEKLDRQLPDVPAHVIAPTGLPRAVSLIGRDDALDELMAKLRAGNAIGIFALEGMGGVGKTALAAEVVARLAEEQSAFPGGAAWIACEGLEGEMGLADLWARVARALRLEQVAAQPDPQARRATLGAALAQQKRLLLALDNLEPTLDADVVLDTLSVRGHTALLLTARQKVAPLRLRAIELAPLPPPDSASLFRERLSQIDATRPTIQDEPALPRLLEAVGGLPLAIELTAAYAGLQRLSLESVLREVEKDGLNAAAFRTDPKKALLARFEHSWKVLSSRQQRLFAGLSLLIGASFPRTAALAVALATVAKGAPDPEIDLLTLVSYTLVEALPGGERLRFHPLLREYAAQKRKALVEAHQGRLGDAMVAYWLEYAQAHPGYEGMGVLEVEVAGLMGALAWAHEQARHQEVLGLARALSQIWLVRGWIDEARLARPWALEAASALGDRHEERWATHELAELDRQTGQMSEARVGFERALELARQMKDPVAEQAEVRELAELNRQMRRLAEARVGFERALELAQQMSDPAVERSAISGLAWLDIDDGKLAEARVGFERALELARQLKDPVAERSAIEGLAWVNANEEKLVEARVGFERALELAQQVKDPAAERSANYGLAWLNANEGKLAEARVGFERALELAQQLKDPVAERSIIHGLTWLNKRVGWLAEAHAGHERLLELARQVNDPIAESVELRRLGVFVVERGDPGSGRKLILEALTICEQLRDILGEGECYQFLARIDEAEGNPVEAIGHFREALRCFAQVQSPSAEKVRTDLQRLEEN
jgi:tetratricopeptide (TPR) repeat protein